MEKSSRFWYCLISVITVLVLVVSSSVTLAHAEFLAGQNESTLTRQAQVTPDGLGSPGLNSLQYANPAAQIDLAQVPQANNQGDAKVNFPLSVPPGRAGVQPDLALSYSSYGGNGWLGLGWDLSLGDVTVDTRWGVPRYSASQETESYALDGDSLSPSALRSTPEARSTGDKKFTLRVEGSFERIVRHGTVPGQYWWEVTDKAGAHRYYGGTPEGGRDEAAILTDANHHEYRWGLNQVRDISGNTMTLTYDKVAGSGVGQSAGPLGKELYLASIRYTGSSVNPDDPAYEVTFLREGRPDVQVEARGGFLHVTSERLKQVVIQYRGSVVRSYTLNYTMGPFGKSLLTSVDQYGKAGSSKLGTHTFSYYDDLNTSGSTYQGFDAGKLQTWNTQNDNVSAGVDLGGFGDGKASALGGQKSLGADGRIYLGFNLLEGSKEGSGGVGLTFKGEDDTAVLEMVDINGDNLPDKVFVQGGAIYYRLNQSGPNGTTTFSDPHVLFGLTHLSAESNFAFAVGPELYFGVSLMYNHAWAWQTGKAYFTDVNADGLPDFVDQGTVYFDHLDANGLPYYNQNNADTAVPIDGGGLDPALQANLSAFAAQIRAQAPLQDVLRRWVAPYDGTVKIEGDVALIQPASGPTGDGVNVAIQVGNSQIWSALIDGGDYAQRTPTGVANVSVTRGEPVYFRVQSRDDGASDQVAWDPRITYLNVSPTLDANGLDIYSYQASQDFTLAGRSGSFTLMPLNGTVHLEGNFVKTRLTTDDITLQVLQNGQVVSSQTFTTSQTGSFPVSIDIPVTGADPANNITGDRLRLLLKIDSPVDLSAFSWAPKLYYTSATQNGQPVQVTDSTGNPTLKLNPPVDTQIYPGTDLTAPQAGWKASSSGNQTITLTGFSAAAKNGTLTLTVKKVITPAKPGDPASTLVAKKTFTIQGGAIQDSDKSLSFSAENGAEYLFDLSVAQPAIGENWSATLDPAVPFARRWAYTPADVFPEPYRGWGIAGYNGDGALASQPVDAARLLFDKNDYPQSAADAPQLKDPNNQQPSYPQDFTGTYKSPAQAKSFAYAPVLVFNAQGIPTGYWRGAKDDLNGSASGQSSSRLGPDSIPDPSLDFSGSTGVILRSTTEADAIAGGLGGVLGGSYAWGASHGLSDFLDLNGDQFPDFLGSGGAQFTQQRGGRDAFAIPLAAFDSIRQDSSSTKTFNGGGDAAEIKADSKGKSTKSKSGVKAGGHRQKKGGSQTSGSFGIGGEEDWSSTNQLSDALPGASIIQSELADMNGDGLPDRVLLYSNGILTVNFNLGYAFDTNQVIWPGGGLEQGGSTATSISGGAGFSYGSLSFSGGITVSSATDTPTSTWTDLNGDGLADQITSSGGVIRVRFGTGAGLTGPVNFGSWQNGVITRGKSQDLNGGADFTIGIGPLCFEADLCYIILNPGVHVDGGAGRQEIDIKDVNGDGYPDDVLSVSDGQMQVVLNQTGRTNLLKTVTNPLGGSFTIDYTRAGNTISEPYSQWVMATVDVNDGRRGDGLNHQLTSYKYSGNIFNALERDFLGYSSVTEEQRDTTKLEAANPPAVDIRDVAFDANFPILRSFERAYRNATVFDKGLLARETLRYPDGTPFKETLYSWSLVDLATHQPANLTPDPAGVGLLQMAVVPQQVKMQINYDQNGAVAKSTWITYAYDDLGNITQTVDVGEPALPADDLVSTMTYTNCRADNQSWVSLPDSFRIQDGNGTTLRYRHAELLCENGAVTKLWEATGSGEAETDLSFDAYGDYNHILYPANENGQRYGVDYTFDPDRFTSIAAVTDSYGLVGSATYDGATGQVLSQADANGQKATYTYDEYGRPASITGPYEQGSGNASVTFEYHPSAPNYAYALAHNFDVFHPGDPIDTVSFADGLGRETETKQDATLFQGAGTPAANRMVVSGAASFDALGRVVQSWYPTSEPLGTPGVYNYNTSNTNPALTTYDIADRITNTQASDGSKTQTSYGFDGGAAFSAKKMFLATQTDPLGNQTLTTTDVRSNQLAILLKSSNGDQKVTYQYDPLQQLVGVTDPGGNQTTYAYDLLGRQTASATPDGGKVENSYDLASHLISKVTPNLRASNGQIHYTYDFNRLTHITYSDGTPNVSYTYGGPGAPGNAAGRITQVTDGARVQQRAYGPLGELTDETTTMLVHNLVAGTQARLTWATHTDFETWGRTKAVTYPDGEVVSYGYDSGGLVASVTGVKTGITYPYITRQEYDEFYSRRFTLDGNQVATETQYDPATRRLSRQTIDAPGRRIQDLNYAYDLAGNMLNLQNNSPTPTTSLMGGTSQQTYTYDDLYRLVSAKGVYNIAPGKVESYNYNLTYDNQGLNNVTRKTQTDLITVSPKKGVPQQKTTYDLLYTYNHTLHQATQIGTRAYTFDLNGNLTGWNDQASGQNRTVTWDAENRATSVADQGSTTTYTYTDDGTLGIQRGPQGEAAFVNRYYTVLNGTVAWKDIWDGDQRIVTKKQMPDGQPELMEYFLHKDLQGSVNLVTDPTGSIFEHLEYFPGGEAWIWEKSDLFHVPELYTSSYFDEFRALYNFGARWYEPREQFFYSPEPALTESPEEVISDPSLLPAYTYAEDNPLVLVDREGRQPGAAQNGWTAATPRAWHTNRYKILKALDPARNKNARRFKAFATFKVQAAISFRLKINPQTGKLYLSNIKVFGVKARSFRPR